VSNGHVESPGDGVDRFEIKLNFDASQIDKAMAVFGIDPDKGKDRRIWFAEIRAGRDGPEALPLLGRGVILRVRAKKSSGDVTLKLRGPDGCIDVAAWRALMDDLDGESKIEGDWAAHRLVSGSLGADLSDEARHALDGPTPDAVDLMSEAQRRLAERLLVPLSGVTLLGPIASRTWEADDDIAAERWTVGDHGDLQFLEVSVVTGDDPEEAQSRLRKRALEGGLDLGDEQEPKTTLVLQHLAGLHGPA
jgi:hypothetical protein